MKDGSSHDDRRIILRSGHKISSPKNTCYEAIKAKGQSYR